MQVGTRCRHYPPNAEVRMRTSWYRAVLFVSGCIAVAVSPAGAQSPAPPAAKLASSKPIAGKISENELAAIRAATDKYRDVKVALADGYVMDPSGMCITSAMEGAPRQLGAMGVHYFRPDLLGLEGDTPRVHGKGMHTDFLKPAVLIYEPQADGTRKLVAIENLVWAKAWQDAGNKEAPVFQGNDYFYMQDNPLTQADEAHGFEPHYELHFWLYRDNPSGMFSPFNPTVSCEHSGH
jgi:hypothetical protein